MCWKPRAWHRVADLSTVCFPNLLILSPCPSASIQAGGGRTDRVCVCVCVCARARVCVPCACLTVALVHQFMKSPAYTVPVVDFIDENCLAFDNEEESKLELSAIHNKFIETVFGLLETYLQEIGVSQEQFSAACQQQLTVGGGNAFVFQQIMATDDFQAFKKMMVSRHRQLEYENLKLLQRQQLAAGMHEDAALSEGGAPGLPGKAPTPAPASESEGEEEDAELQEAIRLSREQCEIFSAHDAQLAEVLRLSAQESEMAPRRAHSPATPSRLAGLQPAGLTEEELVAAAIRESIKASPDEFSAGESLPVSAPPTAASLPATVESVGECCESARMLVRPTAAHARSSGTDGTDGAGQRTLLCCTTTRARRTCMSMPTSSLVSASRRSRLPQTISPAPPREDRARVRCRSQPRRICCLQTLWS